MSRVGKQNIIIPDAEKAFAQETADLIIDQRVPDVMARFTGNLKRAIMGEPVGSLVTV